MIRNVCIHVQNEQPLLADLYAIPTAADAGLLCTNVRMMDGKRPVFIDTIEATFFFPYHVIRFIEIPEGALDGQSAATGSPGTPGRADGSMGAASAVLTDDLADLPALRLPVPVASPDDAADDADGDVELEIDEGFLKRIRDI
ncbi:MAG: hypothetical protein A2V85_13040 [Chloroflexi bacterium RBG_16_72_14]|nr:MAG: hypothetical protein A2V85_13040 [Chloroflexi bacterium RBG_16_72_14]